MALHSCHDYFDDNKKIQKCIAYIKKYKIKLNLTIEKNQLKIDMDGGN